MDPLLGLRVTGLGSVEAHPTATTECDPVKLLTKVHVIALQYSFQPLFVKRRACAQPRMEPARHRRDNGR